jgi:hypothetical protein
MIPADNNNLLIMDGNLGVPLTGSIASGFISDSPEGARWCRINSMMAVHKFATCVY